MNWSQIKNILLGMLIVMNIFVISARIFTRLTTENIPTVVCAAAEMVLQNNDLECPKELLPEKYVSAPQLTVSFPSAAELSERFFAVQTAFSPDSDAITATWDGKVLRVKDIFFSYNSGKSPAKASEKELRRALKKIGFELKNAKYSEKHNMFIPYYKSAPLMDMYITAQLDENGEICTVSGVWPKINSVSSPRSALSIIDHLPGVIKRFQKGKIEDIRFGYKLSDDTVSGTYTFVPAWRVDMTDGRSGVFK